MKPNQIVNFILALSTLMAASAYGQTVTNKAWDVQAVVGGNEVIGDYGVLNNFRVVRPIVIWNLGAFDSQGDGFSGAGTVTIQLYQQQNTDKGDQLLESVTFNAAAPGTLDGCFRYQPLTHPVTLLPGIYTITASGFDKLNKVYNFTLPPSEASGLPAMTLNNGGGAIQFLGCNRFHNGDPGKTSGQDKNMGGADRFAAATFNYSAAAPYASPFAVDYAALTANVPNFPVDAGKTNVYGRAVTLNRYGSMALLQDNAFPLVVEPSGERLILEAASYYNGDQNGSRCVAFGHEQWGHASGDNRMVMFENAIKWAARKTNPSDIVLGLSTNLDAGYFASQGYQVRWVNPNMKDTNANTMLGCDVIALDFNGPYTKRFFTRLTDFAAAGGGVVMTYLPWRDVHGGLHPEFMRINTFLQPYGMAYRSSLTPPSDFTFTNLQPNAYPPVLFNGFSAAELLRENRLGQITLSSLEKIIALHTVSYAADRQPAVLAALTAIYAGFSSNSVSVSLPEDFSDVAAMAGAQTATNYVGQWYVDGNDLVSVDSRGGVEFNFNVPAADVYRVSLFGLQNNPRQDKASYTFILSLDGIVLGQFNMTVGPGISTNIACMTPYILPGPHRLNVFWDNVNVQNQLRLQSLHVQSAPGIVNEAGIKDWVVSLINSQSRLDTTNAVLASYTSPYCVEGTDPFVGLMNISVSGSDQNVPRLMPFNSPNGRWFANVPLASDGNTLLNVSYQNGAKSEARTFQWLPANVLLGGNFTVRAGDSLNFIARPDTASLKDKGSVQFVIGTNAYPARLASAQMPHAFTAPGVVNVMATYTSTNGVVQTGSLTVNVVANTFPDNPAGWVGMTRDWDVNLTPGAVLDADNRLYLEQIAPLPGGGWRDNLMVDQPVSRFILARLGTNGPVLSTTTAHGFNFWHGGDTYTRAVQTYSDGSQLVEMMLVFSPVLPDITIELDVIIGGVVFLDGTTTKKYTAADFDSQGRCFVRFIRPASAKASVCHSILIWQGDKLVGLVL